MSEKFKFYGHELPMSDLNDGEYVTDVVIISRVAWYDEHGDLQDKFKLTRTRSTTPVLLTGMLSAAYTNDITAWNHGAAQ